MCARSISRFLFVVGPLCQLLKSVIDLITDSQSQQFPFPMDETHFWLQLSEFARIARSNPLIVSDVRQITFERQLPAVDLDLGPTDIRHLLDVVNEQKEETFTASLKQAYQKID